MNYKSLTRQLIVGVGILCCFGVAVAQTPAPGTLGIDPPPPIPDSLKTVPVPPVTGTVDGQPVTIDNFIINKPMAIALGKALLWDTAIGSDGQACASCHFSAGADNRVKNQINPGLPHGDTVFNFNN